MSYLPSKKVRVVALVILIIIIGLFWYVGKNKSKNNDLVYVSPEQQAEQERNQKLKEFIQSKIVEKGGLQQQSFNSTPEPIYGTSSIAVNTDNSPTNLKKYGLAIASALTKLNNSEHMNNAQLVLDVLEAKDTSKVVDLKNQAILFAGITQTLSGISVPNSATAIHLELTNQLQLITDLLTKMGAVLDEPDVALAASRTYITAYGDLYTTLNNLNQFFVSKNVRFSETEKVSVPFTENN